MGKKTIVATIIIFAFLISTVAGIQPVKAAKANPHSPNSSLQNINNNSSQVQPDVLPSDTQFNVAGPETRFEVKIVYAYAGVYSPTMEHASAVVLNFTRLASVQNLAFDAEIEFYTINITTNTGVSENYCHFVGTNFKQSFSGTELSYLSQHITFLAAFFNTPGFTGDFRFNWTQNTSFLTISIGSVQSISGGGGASTSGSDGLWRAGVPTNISVAVHRVGYATMSNGSVSLYKDPTDNLAKDIEQLSNYGNGFLYNNLVATEKLSQTDLFHPSSPNPSSNVSPSPSITPTQTATPTQSS